jgi:hypothetical protein
VIIQAQPPDGPSIPIPVDRNLGRNIWNQNDDHAMLAAAGNCQCSAFAQTTGPASLMPDLLNQALINFHNRCGGLPTWYGLTYDQNLGPTELIPCGGVAFPCPPAGCGNPDIVIPTQPPPTVDSLILTIPWFRCPPGWVSDGAGNCCDPLNPSSPCFPKPPAPGWCKPPGVVTTLSTGGVICMFDPPIPSPLPDYIKPLAAFPMGTYAREQRIRAREGREIQRAQLEFSTSFLALNPTLRGGVPLYGAGSPFRCDCDNPNAEEIDEVVGA